MRPDESDYGECSQALIDELLAALGSQVLCSYYGDFNLPPDMVCDSKALHDRANVTRTQISALQGVFFQVTQRANELFQDFLTKLGDDYTPEAVHQFIDWVQRHGVVHHYYTCLSLWAETLSEFDGWTTYGLDPGTSNAILQRGFATYQRLLSSNDKLHSSWTEGKVLSIQDSLETSQPLCSRDPFLERYSRSQQILFIKAILRVERAYRFLWDLKRYGDIAEQNQLIECARLMGANSGWSPTLMARLSMCSAKAS